jgi:hypothetical protein
MWLDLTWKFGEPKDDQFKNYGSKDIVFWPGRSFEFQSYRNIQPTIGVEISTHRPHNHKGLEIHLYWVVLAFVFYTHRE